MKKKIMSVVIALAMIIGSLSSGAHMFSVRTLAAEQDSVIVPCGTDVTSSAFDEYFGAATAAEGVQTLLDKGRITVNGTVIEEKDIYINGAKALWKNEDGYWGWKTHIMRSNERDKEYTLSYNEAAIRFVKGLSLTRGPQFTITLEDGIAKKIDFEIHDACMAETVTRGETTTTVTVCDMDGEYGDGSMNRTNPATISFPNELVEGDKNDELPSDNCMIIYWQDNEGNWHLKRANAQKVTAQNGTKFNDTLINLEWSEPWNRPTQPVQAIGLLGMECEVYQWFYDGSNEEYTSVVSHVDGRTDLGKAIKIVESEIEGLKEKVSEEDYNTFAPVLEKAKKVYADEDLLGTDYDEAFFRLAIAFAGTGGNYHKTGNVFANGYGLKNRTAEIAGIYTYGFIDLEGAKTSAIIVEYTNEIDGSSLENDSFEINDYTKYNISKSGRAKTIEMDYDDEEGNEGEIERIYVNDVPQPSDQGRNKGKYVIIEVNTDYMLSAQNLVYTASMFGSAKQVKDIMSAAGTIIAAGEEEYKNYEIVETVDVSPMGTFVSQTPKVTDKSTIILPEFGEDSGWTLNYQSDADYMLPNSGAAFQATHCYSEYTGEYYDFELPYSIYVPDEATMEANKGKIALVIHMEHAGSNDTDPMAGISSSKAPVKLAEKAKEEGNYAIVVVPQVEETRRSTNDYDASSEVNTAVWELIDWLIEDEYAGYIDTTRVYGTGQSMGIMTILNMGAQRDNFFAGAAVTGGQWSNNYDKPFQNNGSPIRTPEVDPISFGIKDGQGYEHSEEWYNENFENWYYMISDDNIFIHTCNSDGMAWGEWNDTAEYFKTAGVVIPYETYDPYLSVAEQDAIDKALYENNDHTTPGSGIIWSSFTKGNHMSTWKYGWNLDYVFDWLFTQSNETAKARGKVEQLNNEWLGRDEEGNLIEGTGTKGLNSAQYTPRGADKTYTEGWTAIGIVEDAIEALPDPADVTEDDAKAIEAARELYDKLTDAQKAAIDNYDKLIEDEIALLGDDSLEYVEELKEAAEEAQAEADAAKAAAEAAQKAADEAVAAKAADAEAKVAAAEAAQKAAEEKAAAAEEKAAELEKALEEAKKASEDKPADDEKTSPAPGGDLFPDVTLETVNKTSYNSIYWAVDNGIVKGYADGNFKPENICTREQFTIMLWRFAGQPASDAATADRFTDAADFSNNTARSAAAWAVEAGIVSGFSDGTFQPQADITRAQVAVMLYRYAGKPAVDAAESKFSDIGTYSATVQQAIIWAENAGIASGYKDGTFKPDDGCQRQHMAIFLYRYAANLAD